MLFRALVVRWLMMTLALSTLPYFVSGVRVESFSSALWAAALLGVLNVLVKPVLVLLTLPLTIFSLGLFLLFINALLLNFVGHVIQGFTVASLGSAFFAAILISLFTLVMQNIFFTDVSKRAHPFRQHDQFQRQRHAHSESKEQVIDLEEDPDGKWR